MAVKYAFILSDAFAVTVEPVVIVDPRNGDENGARIQVRRVEGGDEPGTRLGDPIWRGDLFRLTAGREGNWDRAHYHPRFRGTAAGQRQMDPELSKDPISWALTQLADLHRLATRAEAPDLAAAAIELQAEVDAVRDQIQVALHESVAAAPSLRTATAS